MTRRYDFTKTKERFDHKRALRTTMYPEIPLSTDDTYVIANDGDRLDLLAQRYYNDPHAWWVIAQANDLGKGSLYVTAGVQIRIPSNLERIYFNLEQINKNR